MSIMYGIDTSKQVTPVMVRDAIITCFIAAHCSQAGYRESDSELAKSYCGDIVRKAFSETGGNFENPTKAMLLNVLPWLADFSKSFRDQTVIQKHMSEIQNLISYLS